MFQNFEVVSDPSVGGARVRLLRDELKRLGLAGFLVPLADEPRRTVFTSTRLASAAHPAIVAFRDALERAAHAR